MRINVTRSSMPSYEEYCNEIKPIFESKWLTNMGPIHNEFKKEVTEYLEVSDVSLFTNGHLALCCALKALNLSGEVITTPFTFASTTHAIVECGLEPVFCDIDPYTFTIDADKIEQLITEKTSAIIPVHVYGNICDVEKIQKISEKYNLKVIYDAAHSFGEKYKGKGIGNYGDVSMFSFHATKVFNTIEGGCLTYSDASLRSRLSKLRNFGIEASESVAETGTNAKMNEFQAAMGICNLRHIDEELLKRKAVYEVYSEKLSGVPGISIARINKDVQFNYSYFPVVFDGYKYSRDEIKGKLERNGIYARKYFYPITSEFACYKNRFRGTTPVALDKSEKILTLPMYAGLEKADVEKICEIILK